MADVLSRSHDMEELRLLDGTVPGWFARNNITGPSDSPSPPRKSIRRVSALPSLGSQRMELSQGSPSGVELRGEATPPQARSSIRVDSAGEMGSTGGGRCMRDYARKLAVAQAQVGTLPQASSHRRKDADLAADVRSIRPTGSMQRSSEGPPSSIRRQSAVSGGAPRPSIRRASAAPALSGSSGSQSRPSTQRGSVGTASTLMAGRPSTSRLSAAGSAIASLQQQPPTAVGAEQQEGEKDQPRVRWRRVAPAGGDTIDQDPAPVPAVGEDRAALMRCIAALAVAEDAPPPAKLHRPPPAEALEQQSQLPNGQKEKPRPQRCPLAPSAFLVAQSSVRSDSASSHDEGLELLRVFNADDGSGAGRQQADWRPVLAAMALSPQQQRAAADARAALDEALVELHVQRAALYKTLCSFATTDADDGLEDAIFDCKQELIKNEAAEAEEQRAFRYHFRSALAGPLLRARPAISAAAPGAAVDFLALADLIVADLKSTGGGDAGGGGSPPPQPMRRRSRGTANPDAIAEECEGE